MSTPPRGAAFYRCGRGQPFARQPPTPPRPQPGASRAGQPVRFGAAANDEPVDNVLSPIERSSAAPRLIGPIGRRHDGPALSTAAPADLSMLSRCWSPLTAGRCDAAGLPFMGPRPRPWFGIPRGGAAARDGVGAMALGTRELAQWASASRQRWLTCVSSGGRVKARGRGCLTGRTTAAPPR